MFLFPKKPKFSIVSKSEQILGSSQLLMIIQSMHEGLFLVDLSLNYLFINQSFIKMTSYDEYDLTGKSFFETVIVKEDRGAAQNLFDEAIKNGMSQGVLVGRTKSNVGFVMKTRLIKRTNELGETIGVFGFVT